jgi:catechol 2,3-dioxygenase-like lactoylglutathione lyase family enzyme
VEEPVSTESQTATTPASGAAGADVIGLLHGGISVSDMDASLAFYHEGLGLPVVVDTIRNAPYLHEALDLPFSELRYVLLGIPGAPGNQVELLEYRGLERMPASARPCDPGSGHVCLQVRDAAAAFARMEALGYRARSAGVVDIDSGVNAGGRLAYVADPDGFWVELLERPA